MKNQKFIEFWKKLCKPVRLSQRNVESPQIDDGFKHPKYTRQGFLERVNSSEWCLAEWIRLVQELKGHE